MNFYKLDVFSEFNCIGSACPETCCGGGWTINIDDNTYEKYNNVKGEFGEKLRANIIKRSDKYCFKIDEDLRCPFLDDSNLCEIYKELGPEEMCFTCKTYPREMMIVTDNDMLISFKLSCPEVARLVFSRKEKLNFCCDRKGESKRLGKEQQKAKDLLLNGLVVSLSIVQNRALKVEQRLKLLILFNDMLEQEAKNGGDTDEIIRAFANENEQLALDGNLVELETEPKLLTKFFLLMINYFVKEKGYLRILSEDVLGVVNRKIADGGLDMDGLVEAIQGESYELCMEHYLVYILFKTYFKAEKEFNFIEMLGFPVYMYCLNACFWALFAEKKGTSLNFEETIVVYSHLSRFTEHNEKVMGEMKEIAAKAGLADTMALLGLV